jgi:hypothetical protein
VQDEIVFRFLDEGVAASAALLREREAPETCRAVLDALPAVGLARHGIYSGSEVYLVLPVLLAPPREHATTIVRPGDVGFLTVEKGSGYGIEEDYSEVLLVLRPRRDALDARGAGRRECLRPALRRGPLLRRLPAHAAGGREEARDRPRVAGPQPAGRASACVPVEARKFRTGTQLETRLTLELKAR